MIARIWSGWTTPEDADEYERILRTEVIPAILARKMPGFRRIEILRREAGDEIEFTTIMRFDSLGDIQAFVGEDIEVSHVPDAARAVLKRFDKRTRHFEIRDEVSA